MIEFLKDYETEAMPPEVFKVSQRVERNPRSEDYFVRIGAAGYVVDGKLVDIDHRPIVGDVATAAALALTAAGLPAMALKDGEVLIGQPPRGSRGPIPRDLIKDAPPVVLAAEVERLMDENAALRAELGDADGEGDDLAIQLADRTKERDGLADEVTALRGTITALTQRAEEAEGAVTEAGGRLLEAEKQIADLTSQLEAATKPQDGEQPKSGKAK